MHEGSFKDFEHLIRLAALFASGLLFFVVVRAEFVPDDFGKYGHYRPGAIAEAAARPMAYAGRTRCTECHEDDGQRSGAREAQGDLVRDVPRRAAEARGRSGGRRSEGGRPDSLPPLPRGQYREALASADGRRQGAFRRGQLRGLPQAARPADGSGAVAMETTRRDFLMIGTKMLVMTAATASALEHVIAGTPEATALVQHRRSLVGDAHRRREVHRRRPLRPRLQDRERRAR